MKDIRRPILVIFSCALLLFWAGLETDVFARAGGGKSSGSRGYSSGGSSSRSTSPSPAPAPSRQYAQQPAPQAPAPSAGRSFLTGIAGGIAGGLIGGMLFRSLGFAGNSGSAEGAGGGGFGFSDILLILIVVGIIFFLVKRFRSKQQAMQMSMAGAGASSYSYPGTAPAEPVYVPAPQAEVPPPAASGLRYIQEADPSFREAAFKETAEDIFFKIQAAWKRRDLSTVRPLLSPQMLNTFQDDVSRMISAKQVNRLENIAVREVEISDAGQDRGEEFITVKFLANLLDYVEDEKTGQVVSGSTSEPVKFLEYWTFSRNVGDRNWVLAGITQDKDR
jgi:predicted lipid-binding transport protein (Tim44 family)